MTKLFASDFDGTLHFHGRPGPLVAERDMEAIAALRKAGGLFGVCTGRALGALTMQTKGHIDFDFYITTSGAALFDGNCQPIWQKTIPREAVREMYEHYAALLSPGEYQIVVAADAYWSLKPLDNGFGIPCVSSFDEIPDPFYGFSIETVTEEAAAAYAVDLNERYRDLAVGHQNLNSVDVVPAGCSKGTGLEMVARHYGATLTAGMGDSFNDLPLMRAADLSYTFHSAAPEVRTAASLLVDCAGEAICDFIARPDGA